MVLDQETFFTSEAAALLNMPTATLTRWLDGYSSRGTTHPPVLREEPRPRRDNWRMVTWGEFIEAGHLAGFNWGRHRRLPYSVLRSYVARWRGREATPYPLARWDPDIDGARVPDVDPPSPEWAIKDFFARVDFEDGTPCRYWPAGRRVPVVVDPARQFGRPIVDGTRITTEVLHGLNTAGGDVEGIADAYNLDVAQVEAAIGFEYKLQLGVRLESDWWPAEVTAEASLRAPVGA